MKVALASLFVCLLFFSGCKTPPPPLTPDDPSAIYFQRAQSASDNDEYDKAIAIYQSFLTNQPNASHEDTFSARYEIAVLKKKEGKLVEAQTDFEGILADLDDLDKSSGTPGWVKLLSQKMLQEVKDKIPKPKVVEPTAN